MRAAAAAIAGIAVLFLVAGPAAAAGPYRYVVHAPSVVTPDFGVWEGNFFVIRKGPGQFLGYAERNGVTLLFRGDSIEHLRPTDQVVLNTRNIPYANFYAAEKFDAQGWQKHFDSCGAWLRYAERVGGRYVGWYHAETNCNYRDNGQTYASTGLATSDDGVRFTPALNRPLLPQPTLTPQRGKILGLAQVSVVRKDPYFWLFMNYIDPDRGSRDNPIVVRVDTEHAVDPSHYEKLVNGTFEPLTRDPGQYERLPGKHGVSPGYSDALGMFYLVGPNGPNISLSYTAGATPTSFRTLDAPLFSTLNRERGRNEPLYVSDRRMRNGRHLIRVGRAPEGGTLLGYVYVKKFAFRRNGKVYYSLPLMECPAAGAGTGPGRFRGAMSFHLNACPSGEKGRPRGYLIDPAHGAKGGYVPLYACGEGSLAGDEAGCGGDGAPRLLGYMSAAPAGAFLSNPAIVGPEGGNHFDTWFHLFYTYIEPGGRQSDRKYVRRRVTVEPRAASDPPVEVEVSAFEDPSGTVWAATQPPLAGPYALKRSLGRVVTSPGRDTAPLIDCAPAPHRGRGGGAPGGPHAARLNVCADGEIEWNLIGYVFRDASGTSRPTVPLYRCLDRARRTFRYGDRAACAAYAEPTLLGYVIADQAG